MIRIVLALSVAAMSAAAQSAPKTILPTPVQITAAVLAAPQEFREAATVLGYNADAKLVVIRKGAGALICLAPDPAVAQFHVACYHKSLDAFMARGRALRASGVKEVDSVRNADVKRGRLKMPNLPAVLYTLTGAPGSFDAVKGTAPTARPLFVIYVPMATGASLGISEKPAENVPWIMSPGTPRAHIMFVPKM